MRLGLHAADGAGNHLLAAHSPEYIAENIADDVRLGLHTADGAGNHLLDSTVAVAL